jgi:hypothetical protein
MEAGVRGLEDPEVILRFWDLSFISIFVVDGTLWWVRFGYCSLMRMRLGWLGTGWNPMGRTLREATTTVLMNCRRSTHRIDAGIGLGTERVYRQHSLGSR